MFKCNKGGFYLPVIKRGTVLYFQDVQKPSIMVGGWDLQTLCFDGPLSNNIYLDFGQDWLILDVQPLLKQLKSVHTLDSLNKLDQDYKDCPALFR